MNDFIEEHARPVLTELHAIATAHAAMTGGALTALEYDPETYPNKSILRHTIKGEALHPIKANELAASVDSRYENLYAATSRCDEVEAIEDVLKSGQSVVLAMDHDELIDAALRPLALANIIKLRNLDKVDKKGRPFFRTGLIVSRMVEFIGVPMMGGVVPANDLFSIGFDLTHETIPSTISTAGRFNKQAMKAYNTLVVREISGNMQRHALSNRRPMLLAMAAPGTITKQLDAAKYTGADIPPEHRTNTHVIGQINYRIADFAQNALTFASTAKLDQTESSVQIDGTPLCVDSPQAIERLAAKLIRLVVARDGDAIHYAYDANGNLPVLRR